jgi:SpoVK/Ycf46/Vps4 family AAA+-type ATPase
MSGGIFASWLGLAEVSPSTLDSCTDETGNHRGSPWSVVLVQSANHTKNDFESTVTNDDRHKSRLLRMSTKTVVQVIPSSALHDGVLYVHPVLSEVLQQLATRINLLEPNEISRSTEMESVINSSSSNTVFSDALSLAPIPALNIMDTTSTMAVNNDYLSLPLYWKATLVDQVPDLPLHCQISVCVLHLDDNGDDDQKFLFSSHVEEEDKESIFLKRIAQSLAGRYIVEGGVIVASLMSISLAVLLITKLDLNSSDIEGWTTTNGVYRIKANCEEFSVCLDKTFLPPYILTMVHLGSSVSHELHDHLQETDCPGYESLLQDLLHFASMVAMPQISPLDTTAAASGILLMGCAGVGKTRLASCFVHRLRHGVAVGQNRNVSVAIKVHWVSVHDLLLRASHETNLIHHLLPPAAASATSGSSWVIIIDDLHVLERSTDSDDDAVMDMELLLVRNAILQAMDQKPRHCLFLALCQSAKLLPQGLLRIGRLEQQLVMQPPTQSQRKAILEKLLSTASEINTTSTPQQVRLKRWVEILAGSPTAGCVAADLRRLCTDALTRALARQTKQTTGIEKVLDSPPVLSVPFAWEDLREAARVCIPSQLAQLDVTKPTSWLTENEAGHAAANDAAHVARRRHEESWRRFGGYPDVKKRVYRTVVAPWVRHLDETDPVDAGSMTIQPPKGVLFHGPSGCGKTLAANCLASSLGLAVVKVRSSDVLDRWLGGSEAILRSLFERARSAAPCILFFDELDAIASSRAVSDQAADVSSRVLSTFLNEMDGISSSTNTNVLVVACSNLLEALDAALLRPGRLEEHVLLAPPSHSDVQAILKLCTGRMPVNNDVHLDEIADMLANATGADVEGVCREACYVALRRSEESDHVEIRKGDFHEAISDWK